MANNRFLPLQPIELDIPAELVAKPTKKKPENTETAIPGRVSARLRQRHTAYLRKLGSRRETVRSGLTAIFLQFGGIVACGFFVKTLAAQEPVVVAPLYLLACFYIGVRQRALANILHECAHGTFVKGRRRNAIFGRCLSFIDLTDWPAYRREHASHHRYVGDPERDLEFKGRLHFFESNGRSFAWQHGIRSLTLFHLSAYLKPVFWTSSEPWIFTVLRVGFLAGVLGLVHAAGLWLPFLLFYVVPYVTAYQVIRYASDALDHAGLLDSGDDYLRSRNHIFESKLLNRLLLPRSDQFHLLHHLFPWLPVRSLGQAHKYLLEAEPLYRDRAHSMQFIREKV